MAVRKEEWYPTPATPFPGQLGSLTAAFSHTHCLMDKLDPSFIIIIVLLTAHMPWLLVDRHKLVLFFAFTFESTRCIQSMNN